jgi:hypothetical protein
VISLYEKENIMMNVMNRHKEIEIQGFLYLGPAAGCGPFTDILQQMQGMPQYFDQVRLCAKRSWSSLPDSGRESTESFLQLKQKANEPWAEFLACVKFNMQIHKGSWFTKLHMRGLPKNVHKLSDQ